ncbi:MAG: hypothetical protein JO279_11045 [Verrucomicrobia bacterium]|nr:hypothetical protein [Verrucomicrobiota bacterium]
MNDSTRGGASICGVKTPETKSRANAIASLGLIASMAVATAEAQNLAPQTPRLSAPEMPRQPAAKTQDLSVLPGQNSIQPQIVQRSSATDAARYLAGMSVSPESPLTRFTSDPRWIAHANAMTGAFSKLDQVQLSEIRMWGAEFLQPVTKFNRTCLYFFSGPDFLYADTFYPDCNTYVLVSLEPIESIPELQSVPPALLQNTLQNLEASLNTLLNFGYFETRDLREYSQRSQLKGVLPIIFVFLARSGKEILNVDYSSLGKGGTHGVKVTFLDPATGVHKALYYFSADLSDDGLKRNPAVLRFCNTLGPTNSLLKAASYLLHQDGFSIARNYLLQVSASILQDDSGIPLRYLTPEKWTLRFFGTYTGPINLFKTFYQRDLLQYYTTSSPKPLPFGFGYQYNSKDATLIFGVRR